MPPRMIADRYEVVSEIGRGGMGLVARAFDHRLQTEVALKIIRRDLTKDPLQTDSLIKEARILARLTNPSVVRLFDLAETEYGWMLILEYVRGPNLAQVLKARSRLTETELLSVMAQICSGLDAAHAEGIVHRDLKPPNLLVATDSAAFESFKKGICTSSFLLEGKVKITDFGISKLLAQNSEGAGIGVARSDNTTLSSAGTPLFMSPEQFQGLPSTPETDIYALGVVAYQALTGTLPFTAESFEELARKHISEPPPPIAECSPGINRAILRALAKKPEDRYSSARAFLAALTGSDEPAVVSSGWQPSNGKSATVAVSIACGVVFILVVLSIAFLARTPTHSDQAFNYIAATPKPPNFGKRITLPEDMDLLPTIGSVPPPSPVPPAAAPLHGPHTPHISWTALIDTEYEVEPWVDAIGPDGTIYIREDRLQTLWALRNNNLRWAFRAVSGNAGAEPLIPRFSHADLRDPGRIWFAQCPDDAWHVRSRCSGAVFNSDGEGGHIRTLPPGIGLPRSHPNTTHPFSETDAQNSHWPEDNPSLVSSSHLGIVTLTSRDGHLSLPLDGRPTLAVDSGSGFFISASSGTIYSLSKDGQVLWTYKSAEAPFDLQLTPAGDLVLLDKDRYTISCVHEGKLRWQYRSPELIDQFDDQAWGDRRFSVMDKDATLYILTTGATAAVVAVDGDGKQVWTFPLGSYIHSGALAIDSRGHLFVSFEQLDVDGHGRGGVICISNRQ